MHGMDRFDEWQSASICCSSRIVCGMLHKITMLQMQQGWGHTLPPPSPA